MLPWGVRVVAALFLGRRININQHLPPSDEVCACLRAEPIRRCGMSTVRYGTMLHIQDLRSHSTGIAMDGNDASVIGRQVLHPIRYGAHLQYCTYCTYSTVTLDKLKKDSIHH